MPGQLCQLKLGDPITFIMFQRLMSACAVLCAPLDRIQVLRIVVCCPLHVAAILLAPKLPMPLAKVGCCRTVSCVDDVFHLHSYLLHVFCVGLVTGCMQLIQTFSSKVRPALASLMGTSSCEVRL